jgi:hypothetical protein
MVPAPTPAPTPYSAISSTGFFTTAAPLPSGWSQPAACISETPTISVGSCYSQSCTVNYSALEPSSWAAFIDGNYYTAPGQLSINSCIPPGSFPVVGFVFTSATGCPGGYHPVQASSDYYGDVTATCCQR